ncbi:MAG: hypothetical protein H7257_10480 [Taibaiella sp.]|nr:hypothetical protein [Taibaiella sp.]
MNPKEMTPTYVHIDSFSFKRDSSVSLSLSNSHQINSVWVYYNDNPIGVYDLPATFPVNATGSGKISVYPGVPVSGLNSFLARYPFYAADTFTLTAQPGTIVAHKPVTHYFSNTRIYPQTSINFDFNITSFTRSDGTVDMGVTNDSTQVFEGLGSAIISLKAPKDTLSESYCTIDFSIPANTAAYIELNYKNTAPFYLGLRSNLSGGIVYKRYLSGIYPSDHWQKFYLAVKDFVAQYTGDTYTLFIKADLPAGQESGTVLLDNIQLVYFD